MVGTSVHLDGVVAKHVVTPPAASRVRDTGGSCSERVNVENMRQGRNDIGSTYISTCETD
jgi:hypothetical protein